MGQQHRLSDEAYQSEVNIGRGPCLAKVVSHADKDYMGTLYVSLITTDSDPLATSGRTFPVRYCPPFFGSINYAFNGSKYLS